MAGKILQDQRPKPKAEPESQYSLSLKVSPKGAVSVYGLQRFPVTLYADQWAAVLGKAEHIRKFIADQNRIGALKGRVEGGGGPQGSMAI